MNIYDLHKGQSATIIGFSNKDLHLLSSDSIKRLIELGCTEGVLITMRWRDPLPDGPVMVEVRGGQVAMGRQEAQTLLVSDQTRAHEETLF